MYFHEFKETDRKKWLSTKDFSTQDRNTKGKSFWKENNRYKAGEDPYKGGL